MLGRGGKSYFTIEVTDTAALRLIQRSRALSSALDKVLPHPIKFKNVWQMARGGGTALYGWKATPPDVSFVALGMICTTTENPPELTCMRCVPLIWCVPSRKPPVKIWDDSGAGGGRPGSIWAINSINLIAIVQGHDIPMDTFYDLNSERFFLTEEMINNISTGATHREESGTFPNLRNKK